MKLCIKNMIWYEINFLNLIIFFSEIYSKVSQNAMVLAKPAIIHFGGFEVDKKHVQSLQIVNASTEVINMHIIPPQTKYFYIKYKKMVRIIDWIPMLSNFQNTSLKWGGDIYSIFFCLFWIVSPTYHLYSWKLVLFLSKIWQFVILLRRKYIIKSELFKNFECFSKCFFFHLNICSFSYSGAFGARANHWLYNRV